MASRWFRKSVFNLHSWLGLHVFIVLGSIFLTGTLLVFGAEIDAAFDETRRVETPSAERNVSFGQLFDGVRAYDPEATILELNRGETSWIADDVVIRTASGTQVTAWSDPQTGTVNGTTGNTDIRRILFEFHASFLTDSPYGNLLLTLFTVPLLLFIITGLISYRRFWKGFFRLPPRHLGARGWWGGAHRLVMLWSLPFLIIITLTSLWYLLGALRLTGEEAYLDIPPTSPRETVLPADFDGTALDRVVAAAVASVPEMDPSLVVLPSHPSGPVAVLGYGPVPLMSDEAQGVFVEPGTFEVLGRYQPSDFPLNMRVNEINDRLHFGDWGGFWSRVLWLGFGILGTFGMAAGALIYAARIAAPDGAEPVVGVSRRLWRAMSVFKWTLPVWAVGILVITGIRFGLF